MGSHAHPFEQLIATHALLALAVVFREKAGFEPFREVRVVQRLVFDALADQSDVREGTGDDMSRLRGEFVECDLFRWRKDGEILAALRRWKGADPFGRFREFGEAEARQRVAETGSRLRAGRLSVVDPTLTCC